MLIKAYAKKLPGIYLEKIWFKERFAACKQMIGIHKMSPLLVRLNLTQMFTTYDI